MKNGFLLAFAKGLFMLVRLKPFKQRRDRRPRVIHVVFGILCIFDCWLPRVVLAIPLQIAGTYTGQINGSPIEATVSGNMDTTGAVLNHFELTFTQPIPNNFNPFAVTNSWKSSYHGAAVFPVSNNYGTAVNLFDLSGGNYIASRTVRWDSLPGEQIVLTGDVTTSGGVMTANNATVNGTYSGPTDLIGVTDYEMVWTQIDLTTIKVISTAKLLRENGLTLDATVTSVYSGLSSQMPTRQQVGDHSYSNESWDGNVMEFDWRGSVAAVPEPGTLVLFGTGLIGLLGLGQKKLNKNAKIFIDKLTASQNDAGLVPG